MTIGIKLPIGTSIKVYQTIYKYLLQFNPSQTET